MGFPRILKNLMLFQNGLGYIGEVPKVTLPKLTRKLEEYRGGGMDQAVKLDMGGEAMEMEFEGGGPLRAALAAWGGSLGGTQLRFAGAYQQDDTGAITSVEVYASGRYEEIDMGEAEVGKPQPVKHKLSLAYYRLEWDGVPVIEVDPINMVLRVDGVDRLADMRAALGI